MGGATPCKERSEQDNANWLLMEGNHMFDSKRCSKLCAACRDMEQDHGRAEGVISKDCKNASNWEVLKVNYENDHWLVEIF